MKKLKKIWLNGKFVDWEEAKVHILTHALHYGTGVFEGIRAYKTKKGPAVFRLDDHLNRLFYSASCLEMKIPFSREELKQAVLDLLKINRLNECYIRPIIFFGCRRMGINPKGTPVRAAIAAWPWKAYLGEGKPVRVKISKYIRIHPDSCIADAKICGYYVNSLLSNLEAKREGFEEAILLDFEGCVAEGPGENVFVVKNKKVYTPPLGNILPGITRDSIIEISQDLAIEIEERKIRTKDLKTADEVFFTGTAAEICPIGKIDDVLINKGKTGEITDRIKKIYQKATRGGEQRYLKWLTFV